MAKRLTKKTIVSAIIALLILGGAVAFVIGKTSGRPFPGFSLEKSIQEDALTHFYQFKNGSIVLRLKVIRGIVGSEAQKLIDGKILTLEALYGNELSPYPGMISNEIVCSKDMTPKKRETSAGPLAISYFIASLTDRFTYGNCVDSETPYRGFIAWTFCPGEKEYRQLELIYPKKSFDERGLEFIGKYICN